MSEPHLPAETNHPTACDGLYGWAREIILENANACLRQSSYPQLWKITCEFYEGVLTLHGIVSSYFLKQLAHIAVVDVEGVKGIANRLEVQYPDSKSNDRDN
jgi:osmotically-inducible protein OsmY